MPKLVKDGDITEDYWTLIEHRSEGAAEDDDDGAKDIDIAELKKGNSLLPLDVWLANQEILSPISKLGVWVQGDTALDDIPEAVLKLPVIAVYFPVFSDGRGFSLARQLREHCEFEGDLRAIGKFALDQMFYLKRCGFTSFVVNESDEDTVNACLNAFTDSYQAAVDEPRPLFRRRS